MAMTISSMANANYSLFNFASKNGASLFGSSGSSSKSDGISQMWNRYAESGASSGLNATNIYSVQKNASEVLSSYDAAKKEFSAEFSSSMSDLSSASSKLKATNFDVGGPEALSKSTTVTKDANGKEVTSTKLDMSDGLKTAVENVKDFVDKYNEAVKLFSDNASLSKRMSYISNEFSDATYRAGSYENIGIHVGKGGMLSVDEEQLATAITESPNKVASILGKNGLAGKADAHVQSANAQKDKLFPSVDALFGSELKTAQAYTGSSLLAMNKYTAVGSFFDMSF